MKKTVFIISLALLAGCTSNKEQETEKVIALDVSNMDPSVDPKSDFYTFVNGKWVEKTELPANEGRWGIFPELRLRSQEVVLDILTKAGKSGKYGEGTDQKKALDFFSVGMDSVLAERIGAQAVKGWYDKIDALGDKNQIQGLVSELHKKGYQPFGGMFVFGDLMNSKMNALYMGSGGIGLPNRDFYTKTDSKSKEIRDKYVQHIARMLELSNAGGDFQAQAKSIMDIENELALATLTPIEQRNIPAQYNPMAAADFTKSSSNFDWGQYFVDAGMNADTIIVTEPKFFKGMDSAIGSHSLDELKSYLKWHVINRAAPYMNQELVDADFDFFGKILQGTQQNKPRWERVLSSTNQAVGEAVGKLYVDETFPPQAKTTALEMVKNLQAAYENRINALPWMSDATKEKAINKLKSLTIKIGYPDKWKDYSKLEVSSSGEGYSYLGNIENSSSFAFDESMDKVGKPVDRAEWGMTPQTVNAYYNPVNNEIVFPAAILQPPFFNFEADPAINYGGIGGVIGHEISHGFDDQGSQFDADGNMINWWTDDDRGNFQSRIQMLISQYDKYEPLDSLHVQGALTVGENIGDLGGINAAYDALQLHYKNNPKPDLIDGYTQEQRFFISWATVWRSKYRDEFLRTQVMTDPHSPGMYRAVGPLENMETFFNAFDIRQGDPMWKADSLRVKIW